MLNKNHIEECENITLVKTISKFDVGILLHDNLHTSYKSSGGVIYMVERRIIISPDKGDDAYEVKLDNKINDFVTDGSNLLFDLLAFDGM